MLMAALKIGEPKLMLEWFSTHEQLLYHPAEEVIQAYLDHFAEQFESDPSTYESGLKEFFNSTKKRYFMQRPKDFYTRIISLAHQAGDKQTVIDAYLEILDYKSQDDQVFLTTIDNMSYTE
jgi:hypothetical protein